jgi:hypothetical protein
MTHITSQQGQGVEFKSFRVVSRLSRHHHDAAALEARTTTLTTAPFDYIGSVLSVRPKGDVRTQQGLRRFLIGGCGAEDNLKPETRNCESAQPNHIRATVDSSQYERLYPRILKS